MRTLLCIMNGRRIPECIEAFEALDCDRAWMSGYTDHELGDVHRELVASTDYDAYITVSDDCVVTQQAYDAVAALLEDGHPAATGWCRLHTRSNDVNLCWAPLLGDVPCRAAYRFYTYAQICQEERQVIPTHFMGLALTGMPREGWERFPHRAYTNRRSRGYSSDFNLSRRLRDARVPMVAAKAGYVEHLKVVGRRKPPTHRLLVGEMDREVRIEERRPA